MISLFSMHSVRIHFIQETFHRERSIVLRKNPGPVGIFSAIRAILSASSCSTLPSDSAFRSGTRHPALIEVNPRKSPADVRGMDGVAPSRHPRIHPSIPVYLLAVEPHSLYLILLQEGNFLSESFFSGGDSVEVDAGGDGPSLVVTSLPEDFVDSGFEGT